jgi:hypothetical protein
MWHINRDCRRGQERVMLVVVLFIAHLILKRKIRLPNSAWSHSLRSFMYLKPQAPHSPTVATA